MRTGRCTRRSKLYGRKGWNDSMMFAGWIRRRLAVRIAVQVIVLMMIMSAGYIGLQVANAKRAALEVITSHGQHIAEHYVQSIDVEQLDQFMAAPEENETYWSIRAELNRFREQTGALYVYIFHIDENRMPFIMIDGEPEDSEDASPIHEEMPLTEEEINQLLAGRSASSPEIEDTEYGLLASAYAPIKREDGTTAGYLGMDTDASMIDSIASGILRDTVPYFLAMIGYAIAGTGVVLWLIARALRPLKRMVSGAQHIAGGDFQSADRLLKEHPVRSPDEIGEMYRIMVNMSGSLNTIIREMVSGVARTADQLVAASDAVAKEARELLASSSRVREAASRVAEGTSAQRAGSEESGRSMEETAVSIQRISAAAMDVADAAGDAQGSAERGGDLITELSGQIRTISSSTEETVHRAEALRSRSHEIEEAIGGISQIAEQTKLLALNASIEAARAGEHGTGFAVVAGEVRKLADETARSAERVAALLGDINNESLRISDAMQRTSEEVKAGVAQFGNIQETFTDIVEKFRTVSAHIQDISAAAQQISAGSEEVSAAAADIARIARESNEQALHIREQTEMQQSGARSVSAAVEELGAAVRRLRETVQTIQV